MQYRCDAAGNGPNAVDALNRMLHDSTNFLGGARLTVGSNKLSIVARDGASRDTEQTRAVFAPPTNPQAFRYDLNGNLVSDGFRDYTWDEENRLTRVAATVAVPTAARKRCDYVYDAQSRRVRTVLRNWSGSAWVVASTNTFVYDGWNPIAAVTRPTGGAAVTNHYVWGLDLSGSLQGAGGIGGLLARYTQSGATATATMLYTYDGNGNVTVVANVTGATVAQYRYDPFGVVVSATGAVAADNKVRWSTKWADDASGLVYYGYRWYAPEQRRWVSKDPMEERGSQNLYAFVLNSALSHVDFCGLVAVPVNATVPVVAEMNTNHPDRDGREVGELVEVKARIVRSVKGKLSPIEEPKMKDAPTAGAGDQFFCCKCDRVEVTFYETYKWIENQLPGATHPNAWMEEPDLRRSLQAEFEQKERTYIVRTQEACQAKCDSDLDNAKWVAAQPSMPRPRKITSERLPERHTPSDPRRRGW